MSLSDHELKRDDVIISRWQWWFCSSLERRTGKVHWLDGEQRNLAWWVGLKGVKWSSAPYPGYWKQWRRKWRIALTNCRTFSSVGKSFQKSLPHARLVGAKKIQLRPLFHTSSAKWVRYALNLLRCEPVGTWSQTAARLLFFLLWTPITHFQDRLDVFRLE